MIAPDRKAIVATSAGSAAVAACLCACAVPATQVQVPTKSMREALEQSRTPRSPVTAIPEPIRSAPPGAPRPNLSTPEVRMAYLYDWVDREGNQHFGSWVAIALSGYDWILGPGSRSPASGATPTPTRAPAPAPPDAGTPLQGPSQEPQ